MKLPKNLQTAVLGGGCFWCVEAVFLALEGVENVKSGYAGGKISNPTYREICSGLTGHAEVVQVTFDAGIITYEEILEIFFSTHDPTTLNRQGADRGTQYRSTIMYHNETQQKTAERVKEKLKDYFKSPIVTEIVPMGVFYDAEAYHQNYYAQHEDQPYCMAVINPKLAKLRQLHADKLKRD